MQTTVKATDIRPGMVVEIYAGTERVAVSSARADAYGAVIITDGIRTRGLSAGESVPLVGWFNPDPTV